MASIFDTLLGVGKIAAQAPVDFFQGAYETTPAGQLEKQKRELEQQNSILAQITNNPNLSQQQKLEALSQASPEFMQKRLELMLQPPKPLKIENVSYDEMGNPRVAILDPNTNELKFTGAGTQGGFGSTPSSNQQPMVQPQAGIMPMPQGLAPAAQVAFQKKQVEQLVDKEAAKPKAMASFQAMQSKTENALNALKEAKNLTSNFSAGYGSLLAAVPTTDARALRAQLDTLKANLGTQELQEMRANSPTGGALGNSSDKDLAMLQSMVAALDQAQTPEQLNKAYKQVEAYLSKRDSRYASALKSDFGINVPKFEIKNEKTPVGGDLSKMSDAQLMQLLQSLPE